MLMLVAAGLKLGISYDVCTYGLNCEHTFKQEVNLATLVSMNYTCDRFNALVHKAYLVELTGNSYNHGKVIKSIQVYENINLY